MASHLVRHGVSARAVLLSNPNRHHERANLILYNPHCRSVCFVAESKYVLLNSQAMQALKVAPPIEVAYSLSSQVISEPLVLDSTLPQRSAHCGEDWSTRRAFVRVERARASNTERGRILIEERTEISQRNVARWYAVLSSVMRPIRY
jgi:hypothetical protein